MHMSFNQCQLIGMLHVPVNSILASPSAWTMTLGLPSATVKDWREICDIEFAIKFQLEKTNLEPFNPMVGDSLFEEFEKRAKSFSFFSFLSDRMLCEAELYFQNGADALMLENIAAPYFVRNEQPLVIIAVMSLLAKILRGTYPERRFGIQILAFGDDQAMEIALKNKFSFVRSESAIFEGLRPEGRTPNHGNLAKLYFRRNMATTLKNDNSQEPIVLVDFMKKHTVFNSELEKFEPWIENILFQKIEGIVITGAGTGCPVDEERMEIVRKKIDAIKVWTKESLHGIWRPRLFIGSGVSIHNLDVCKRYADGVIIGSSLKENGYWELPIDEKALKQFMEKWHG